MTLHLVQLLLPVADNAGKRFPPALYSRIRSELTERFGGLTAFSRSPAEGVWQEGDGDTARDDIIVYEVMTDQLDVEWWRAYRAELERAFEQDELVIRAQLIERL